MYDWVQVELQLQPPASSMSFDSRKPPETPNPQTAAFAAIVG